MLDVGWSEILVIAIVMIVVVGPKDLPKMLRAFGKATARMRTTANEFKRQFDDALKEAELEDVKNIIDETRKLDPRAKMTQVFDPIRMAGNDLKASLNQSTKTVDSSAYKNNPADVPSQEDEVVLAARADVQTPSDAIAEAVKKNLKDEVEAEEAKPVKAKPATKARKPAKAKNTVKEAAPSASTAVKSASKTTVAKVAAKPVATKKTVAKVATVKAADTKTAAPKKTTAKKAPAKKPAAKTTGTNE